MANENEDRTIITARRELEKENDGIYRDLMRRITTPAAREALETLHKNMKAGQDPNSEENRELRGSVDGVLERKKEDFEKYVNNATVLHASRVTNESRTKSFMEGMKNIKPEPSLITEGAKEKVEENMRARDAALEKLKPIEKTVLETIENKDSAVAKKLQKKIMDEGKTEWENENAATYKELMGKIKTPEAREALKTLNDNLKAGQDPDSEENMELRKTVNGVLDRTAVRFADYIGNASVLYASRNLEKEEPSAVAMAKGNTKQRMKDLIDKTYPSFDESISIPAKKSIEVSAKDISIKKKEEPQTKTVAEAKKPRRERE